MVPTVSVHAKWCPVLCSYRVLAPFERFLSGHVITLPNVIFSGYNNTLLEWISIACVKDNIFHLFLSLQVCFDSTDWVFPFPIFLLFLCPVCVCYVLSECIPLTYHMFDTHSSWVFHIQTLSSFHSVCWVWWTIHVTLYRSAFGLFILDSTWR